MALGRVAFVAVALCLAALASAESSSRSYRVAPSVAVDDAFMQYLMSKPGMPAQLKANFTRAAVEAYFDMPPKRLESEAVAHLPPMKVGEDGGGGKIDPEVLKLVGKAIWDLLQSGKSVVDSNTDYGGAVPEDADWKQMSHWQNRIWSEAIPQMHYAWHNTFGNQVVFNWYWVWNYNGRYQGKGKYMNLGTAIPLLIDCSWGYDIKAKVSASNPSNFGTDETVSGVNFQLSIDVTNWRGGSERIVHVVVLKGDGTGTST